MSWHNRNPRLETLIADRFDEQWRRSLKPQEGNEKGDHNKSFLKKEDAEWNKRHPDDRRMSRRDIIFLKDERDQMTDDLVRWFVPWAAKEYGGQVKYKSIEQIVEKHPTVAHDFLEYFYSAKSERSGKPFSPATDHKVRTEIVKLFELTPEQSCEKSEFLPPTPVRHYSTITQSRLETKTDAHFKESNHPEFVSFCRTFGPRKYIELTKITGSQLGYDEKAGRYYIQIYNGKGGKDRRAYLYGPKEEIEATVKLMRSVAPNEKVCPHPWKNADVHSYRHDYAQRV
jgi:hypothetical protein